MFHQELDAVWALGAGAPADRPVARALLDHVDRAAHHVVLLIAREVAGDLVMVAVPRHFVPAGDDRLHGFRIALGDAPAGQERRLHALLFEDTQDAPHAGIRPVLGLGVFLVIHAAVRQRPHVFAALEIERERDRDPPVVRPEHAVVRMIFLQHYYLRDRRFPDAFLPPTMRLSMRDSNGRERLAQILARSQALDRHPDARRSRCDRSLEGRRPISRRNRAVVLRGPGAGKRLRRSRPRRQSSSPPAPSAWSRSRSSTKSAPSRRAGRCLPWRRSTSASYW